MLLFIFRFFERLVLAVTGRPIHNAIRLVTQTLIIFRRDVEENELRFRVIFSTPADALSLHSRQLTNLPGYLAAALNSKFD